jgi:DNA-binding SARP family transcriptional activator/tetratricopeptide (TPR) repeat protein
MSVRIALLGEVTAEVDGRPVDLGPARQRCVLAALAVEAGRLVPAEQLVGRVWGADTPRRGRATLHSHISRLRKVFAGELAIVHRSNGYALEPGRGEETVDLLRFRALCGQARDAGEDTRTAALLTDALALWRGEPLSGLSGEWVETERDRWRQERFAAEQDLVDARLRAGQGEELVAQLSARTARHPLDERVAGQYMLALHRAGRAAAALDYYRRLRERLVEELGTTPGTALQDLHRQLLAADPGLSTTPASVAGPGVIPQQVPAAPARFVGRQGELDSLNVSLSPAEEVPDEVPGGGLVLISAIGGAGGIGKTWLALHWAHRNLHRFPDGQLFVDLHGFSPDGRPAQPADVLGGFLDALGVDRERQPTDLERRADLYRSLVAGKRMLVVLDNAATSEQITPLLPGGRHCTVLITSRDHLHGFIARHGAHPIRLDVLTDPEAHALLTVALGPGRAAADAPAVADLIELCSGLPLALGLVAARAVADPHLPLTDVVDDLRTLGLDALESEDPTASLPTVLSWSLRHLTDRQRRLFALLGIAPGPGIGLPAAACLAGLDEREAHAVLRVLADVSLIDRVPGGRYRMHDLVRAYATTVADALPAEARETALRRIVDFYTHTAHAADRLLGPHREPARLDPPVPGVRPHPLPDAAAALAWFDTEHACLLAAQRTAAGHDWHAGVWHLAWALNTFHFRRGLLHDRLTVWQAAVGAAVHLPDHAGHTLAHRLLGSAHAELGRHEDAVDHLHQALTLAKRHGDDNQQAATHHMLARACEQRGDDAQALEHARRALDIYRGLDLPGHEANALNGVGWYAARQGDYDTAREHCLAALELNRRHHNPSSEASTLDSLGYIEHHSGHHDRAVDHYSEAVALFRDLGNSYEVADTLDGLGHPLAAAGRTEQARTVWREALQLYQEQDRDDDAARVQRRLDGP